MITLHIPKNSKGFDINKELNSAKNIKDRVNRQATITGLTKIANYLNTVKQDGVSLYWDDKNLFDIPYDGTEKEYHCGKQLKVKGVSQPKSKYLLVVLDTTECTIGLLHGKKISTLWNKHSNIEGKHRKGGQSAARFERLRNEQIKQWFKKIGYKVLEFNKI